MSIYALYSNKILPVPRSVSLMLLKAPIHNLTLSPIKLLIYCFDVNSLNENPIIGQISSIYVHFQQYFPYFSNYVTFYCAKICLPTAYFTSSRYVLKHGFPKFGLFFQNTPLVFVVVNAHPKLMQIFGNIAHGGYRARLRYYIAMQ